MTDPRRDCPNCGQRIHPLNLSDLYRGRLLNCSQCGTGLRAKVAGWASVPFGLLAWWLTMSWVETVAGSTFLGVLLGGLLAGLVLWLIRLCLVIEGSPWVKLSARDEPWKSRQRSTLRSIFSNK